MDLSKMDQDEKDRMVLDILTEYLPHILELVSREIYESKQRAKENPDQPKRLTLYDALARAHEGKRLRQKLTYSLVDQRSELQGCV